MKTTKMLFVLMMVFVVEGSTFFGCVRAAESESSDFEIVEYYPETIVRELKNITWGQNHPEAEKLNAAKEKVKDFLTIVYKEFLQSKNAYSKKLNEFGKKKKEDVLSSDEDVPLKAEKSFFEKEIEGYKKRVRRLEQGNDAFCNKQNDVIASRIHNSGKGVLNIINRDLEEMEESFEPGFLGLLRDLVSGKERAYDTLAKLEIKLKVEQYKFEIYQLISQMLGILHPELFERRQFANYVISRKLGLIEYLEESGLREGNQAIFFFFFRSQIPGKFNVLVKRIINCETTVKDGKIEMVDIEEQLGKDIDDNCEKYSKECKKKYDKDRDELKEMINEELREFREKLKTGEVL